MKAILILFFVSMFILKGSAQTPREIPDESASQHFGETLAVDGEIKETKEVIDSLLLYLGKSHPNQTITIILKGQAISSYKHLQDKIRFHDVIAIGKIVPYKGKAAIVITRPQDLKVAVIKD